MGRPEFVGISEPLLKHGAGRRLPAIELPVSRRVVNAISKASKDHKSPSMIYESFKGLKLTSRPCSQSNRARLWQELGQTTQNDLRGSLDLRHLHDLTVQLSGAEQTTADDFHSDLDTVDGGGQSVTFRFSFKTMDTCGGEDKENASRSQASRGSRFTSLETAADKENMKLGLSQVKMTPLQSPRVVKGNPLESLAIGQRPDKSDDKKTAKKRLLRKPLPLNHYKKSQKVRILQNSDVSGLVSVGQVSNSAEISDSDVSGLKQTSGVYNSVSEWLSNIDGQEFDQVSSNGDIDETCQFDVNLDCKQNVDDPEVGEQLEPDLKSAQSLKHKTDPKFAYTRGSGTLPDISDKLLRPNPKMREFQGRFSKMGEFEPIESDDEEYAESCSQKSDDIHFPRITHYPHDSRSSRSANSSKAGDDGRDVRLPRLLLDDDSDDNSEELERQRLKLIHLEATAPDTTRSEPMYLPGQYMYINKGASSHKYSKKHLSLKEMAASFQRKMAHSLDYPDHSDGKKILTDKFSKHTSVIDQNAYDYFARKNKPKPAMFSPGITLNAGPKVKQKEITFPKQCERINGNVDPALELNYAKLKHNLRRDHTHMSTTSLSSRGRRRSGSQDRLRRANSMTSITSSTYGGHTSRRDSSRSKDSACARHRRRGRSHSKNRSRSTRIDRDYD